MKASVVFMGTPASALPVLEALLVAGHEIRRVYTQPDRPAGRGREVEPSAVKHSALQQGLAVSQPAIWRSAEALAELAAMAPQVIVVAAYGRLLPPQVLRVPPKGCLNIHPSLLPRYRGPSPVVTAILEGEKRTGVTVMLMDEGMDTGPILAQRTVEVTSDDTGGSLTHRLFEEGGRLLVETLPLWLEGKLVPVPQDASQATVTRRITKEDGQLDWAQPAERLWRQVRALDPWPGTYTTWRGKLLKVLEASVLPAPVQGASGLVVVAEHDRQPVLAVATGEGTALVLSRLQLEGRRPLSAEEFLRGHLDFVGSRLPS